MKTLVETIAEYMKGRKDAIFSADKNLFIIHKKDNQIYVEINHDQDIPLNHVDASLLIDIVNRIPEQPEQPEPNISTESKTETKEQEPAPKEIDYLDPAQNPLIKTD